MSLPVLNFRSIPTDLREWARTLFDLNGAIRKRGSRVFAEKHRFLNPISTANKQSTQSAQPLTSTDSGGGFAQIEIAAHNLQDGDGVVAYGAGTITGLPNSTLEYVYANDPDKDGGAVTYLATTNATLITASTGLYYVGKITTDAGGGGGSSGGYGGGGGGGGFPLP